MRWCTAIAFSAPERCSGLLGMLGMSCSVEVNDVRHLNAFESLSHLRLQFSSGLSLSISLFHGIFQTPLNNRVGLRQLIYAFD